MSKHYLCKCNKCETIMFDENPATDQNYVVIEDVKEPIDSMIHLDGNHWVCPNCETDDYLIDYVPANDVEIKAETYIQFSKSAKMIVCDMESLSENIQLYSSTIKTIKEYGCEEVEMFGVDLNLKCETLDAIKKLIQEDLQETQNDWANEIEDMRQKLLLKVTKL